MGRNSNFYDGADSRTYRFPAVAVDTSGVAGRFIGPAGKVGRVRGIEFLCTVQCTGADSDVTVGNNAAANPASLLISAQAQFAGEAQTDAEVKANGDESTGRELAADTVVEVASDGGLTAGDGDVTVHVDWY